MVIPADTGHFNWVAGPPLVAVQGQLDAVKYLITHWHPLHVRDRWLATPLDEAMREQRATVVEYLREHIAQAGGAADRWHRFP